MTRTLTIDQLPLRLAEKIRILDNGCWEWVAAKASRGSSYGSVWWEGRTQPAHRVIYQFFFGEFPREFVLDHYKYPQDDCIGPLCCYPLHMKITTQQENILRGSSVSAANVLKTHCPNGHEYTEANIYWKKGKSGPQRECRTCRSDNRRKWKQSHVEHERQYLRDWRSQSRL